MTQWIPGWLNAIKKNSSVESSFLNNGNQFHELKKNDQGLVSGER